MININDRACNILYIIDHCIYWKLHHRTPKWWARGPKYDKRKPESVGEAWDSLELDLAEMEDEKYA